MGKLKVFINKSCLLVVGLFLVGCSTGHCRGKNMAGEKVFIFKPDGTKQCAKQPGVSLDEMATQLKDIQIFSKENRYDGQMHITLCGSATGKVNVYEIKRDDLEKAIQLGFQELK